MKNQYLSRVLRKVINRLSCAVVLALLTAIQIASAQAAGNSHKGAPERVIKALTAGFSQDLIVVFDDKVAQKSAEELQSQAILPSHHSRIIKHKASKYAEIKQKVLSAFAPLESTELKSYSNLPIGFLRIHSKEALDKLLASSDVAGVYENTVMRKALAESLPLIGQPQAAALGDQGAGTAVAVLDTGVDYTRTAFGSCTPNDVPNNCKVVYAQDFTSTNDGMLDGDGHGTNVAGIVLGVAPAAKIVALDVFDGDSAYTSDILDAISWVIDNKTTYNIVAINMSLGGSDNYSSPETKGTYSTAVHQARLAGILTVAAAGNEGYTNALPQPAATSEVISVGAVYDSTMGTFNWGSCTDSYSAADKVTCFSNSASFLTLLAPGSRIFAAGITESGTSQASPHVAGAVAVLRAAFPDETLDQTVARLTNGVMVTDSRNNIPKPRLNLQTALGLNASCTYSISETSKSYSSISSSGSVAVTTGAGCTWSATSNTSNSGWITVTSGSSGSGNGTVNYSVSANADIASRTGTITVAGQTYTVTQSGSVGTVSNILLNPGFEDGPVSWTESSESGYSVITPYLNPTASNSWYAWLCGYNNCVEKLYQDVTVPADAQSAYVQFNYRITTEETSSVTAYDSMTVRIYSPPSATTYTSWTLSNLNATTGWVQSLKYDVSAFKGQAIRLQFSATTNPKFATDFLVDDVTLMVSGSTPDTQAPTVPTELTVAAISTSAINLAWNASTDNVGVTAYKLYRDNTLLATLGNVTSYGNTGLAAGISYSYTVSACDAAGNCSAQSTSASATTNVTTKYTVTPTTGSGFTITPSTPQEVNNNATTSFTVTPVTGYGIVSVNGCGGSFSNGTYTTGSITSNCTISVAAVARNANSGGSAQPPTIGDALKVLQAVVGITTLTATEQIRYDVAPLSTTGTPLGNGVLDAADVVLILRRSIGIGSW